LIWKENRAIGTAWVRLIFVEEFRELFVEGWESIIATLEILADRELAKRLLKLSKTIDDDLAAGRLLTTADAFGPQASPGKRSK
jgi:hypothetical protein